MKSFFAREVLAHPAVVVSCIASVALIFGSFWYYQASTTPPATVSESLASTSPATITAEGTVVPSENPDLYFEASGRVAHVNVAVGDQVSAGELLASLDTSALSAARDQAAANLEIARAKLDALKAGARSVDISAKETAVAQAKQSLSNLYAQAPNDLGAAYSNSLGAVHAYTDTLFNSPDINPTLAFPTSNAQTATNAGNSRGDINTMLVTWETELANANSDQAAIDQELQNGIAHLAQLRTYANLLTQALGGAQPSATFTSTVIASDNTNLGLLRASIGGSLATLQADAQAIASAKLAVTSAQNALAQLEAPATSQDLEAAQASVSAAQASLSSAQAALGNAVITAPFTGSVSAVRVKVGDFASQSLAAISLTPKSALEIEGYLSETDAAHVSPGQQATATLDAFGASHPFAVTISSIDRAPTLEQGVPAYKVTLQFNENDPSLASGMTANISITPR